MTVQPGEILASKYRIDGVLGAGGMGTVFAATHIELEQRVAIKVPHAQQVSDPTFAARFMREGRNAAKLRSDHVARVIDVGRTDGGTPFLVMEHLSGHDLSTHLKAVSRMSVPDAVDILLQTCDAVASAHAVGIVHRDLKPANLFLEQRQLGAHYVKVLDFGISKVLVTDDAALEAALTNTTGVVGSPMYMSPEQMVAARNVDTRTDVWSLGLILFKCLTGKTPWPSGNVIELAARIAQEPPIRARALAPEVPEALENVILRCLEKDRDRRLASVLELASAIAPFDPGRGAHTLRQIGRGVAPFPGVEASGQTTVEPETLATAAITLHTDVEGQRPDETRTIATGPSFIDGTTGTAIRHKGSTTRLVIVAAVVTVAMTIGVLALVRATARAPQSAASAPPEVPIVKPAISIAPPPPAIDPEPPAAPPSSASVKPAAIASTKPATKPGKLKEWDGTPTVPAKPAKSGSDPWGGW